MQGGPAEAAGAAPAPASQRAGSERIFKDLDNWHGAPGLWHLCYLNFLRIIYKMYFPYLLRYIAHDILHRKGVDQSVKNYFVCEQVFFHTWEALMILMLQEWERHEVYLEAEANGLLETPEQQLDNFISWLEIGHASTDEVFKFYSSFVFGIGMIFRLQPMSIKIMDLPLVWATLLIQLGYAVLTGRHNIKRECVHGPPSPLMLHTSQGSATHIPCEAYPMTLPHATTRCALTLIKILSCDAEVARMMWANVCAKPQPHSNP